MDAKMGLNRLHAILVLVLLTAGGCVPLPAAPSVPSATDGASQAVVESVALNRAPAGRLEASRVSAAPRLDGQMDAVWATARPLRIPLAAPSHGSGPQGAREIELHAVHTADTLYLLARWPGEPPPDAPDTTFNQLTIHWTIRTVAGSPTPACGVACHTAYVDGRGRVAYMNSETIPQGGQDALLAGGGWADGEWSVAWSRPLVSANAYDVQFDDLSATSLFFVKVFERADGRSDAVSKPYALVFVP
jgi:hypothetical protein